MSEDKPTALAARQMIQKAMTVTREKIVPMEFDESVLCHYYWTNA